MDNKTKAHKNILGIILAGGKSSRMGQNKAFLSYGGVPLIAHMLRIVQSANIHNICISGQVLGYEHLCISDTIPDAGPAHAIKDIMETHANYDGYMVVPVDMPLLRADMIHTLCQHPQGAIFAQYTLPAYIPRPKKNIGIAPHTSVQHLLIHLKIPQITLPHIFKPHMKNTNTPEQWRQVCTPCK